MISEPRGDWVVIKRSSSNHAPTIKLPPNSQDLHLLHEDACRLILTGEHEISRSKIGHEHCRPCGIQPCGIQPRGIQPRGIQPCGILTNLLGPRHTVLCELQGPYGAHAHMGERADTAGEAQQGGRGSTSSGRRGFGSHWPHLAPLCCRGQLRSNPQKRRREGHGRR